MGVSTSPQINNSASVLDQLCINTIRTLSLDAVQKAESGHPGLPLGAAPMAYVLWTRFLRHNPKNPKWENRDRFLLSAGHGSMLLYSLLYLTGYDLPLEELKNFRQWNSKTPGHPEYGLTPGVETTTVLGPVGMPRLAVEAGVPQGWCRYVGEQGAVLGVNRFGASAPGKDILL